MKILDHLWIWHCKEKCLALRNWPYCSQVMMFHQIGRPSLLDVSWHLGILLKHYRLRRRQRASDCVVGKGIIGTAVFGTGNLSASNINQLPVVPRSVAGVQAWQPPMQSVLVFDAYFLISWKCLRLNFLKFWKSMKNLKIIKYFVTIFSLKF